MNINDLVEKAQYGDNCAKEQLLNCFQALYDKIRKRCKIIRKKA